MSDVLTTRAELRVLSKSDPKVVRVGPGLSCSAALLCKVVTALRRTTHVRAWISADDRFFVVDYRTKGSHGRLRLRCDKVES